MKTSLSLFLAVAATMATVPCQAVEPEPAAATPPARLSFADGWTLRSSEPGDGRTVEADAAGPTATPRSAPAAVR